MCSRRKAGVEPWEETSQDTPEPHTEEMAGASSVMLSRCGSERSFLKGDLAQELNSEVPAPPDANVCHPPLSAWRQMIHSTISPEGDQWTNSTVIHYMPSSTSAPVHFKILKFHFLLMEGFVCGSVCSLLARLVPAEARRGRWIPFNWSYRWL